jgi:hypothetical protein
MDLGMRGVIEEMTLGHRTRPSQKELDRFKMGVELLRKTSMDKKFINKQLKEAEKMKMVYDENGKWNYINKLNTNHSDLAILLTDVIMKAYEDTPEPTLELYKRIMVDPKEGLMSIRNNLYKMIEKYFTFEDLKGYTKQAKRFSKIGEEAEEEVKSYLDFMGYKIEYTGGNGDMIDMLFSTDMIISDDKGKYITIQIKRTEMDLARLKYLKVDWLVFTKPSFKFYERISEKQLLESDIKLW